MTYLNLYSTNGSPTGDNVSEELALNNNYEAIDTGIYNGFQAFNTGAAPSYAGGEVGQSVYPSYYQDYGGAPLYNYDGANWHHSDQKEVFSAWSNLAITNSTYFPFNCFASYRVSNFKQVEWKIALNYFNTPPKGSWIMVHDPTVATTGQRIPYTTYGPNNPSGYGNGIFVVEGAMAFDPASQPGYGEQIRFAFDLVTVASVDCVRVRCCYTDLATSAGGMTTANLQCAYDAGSGYAGCS